VEILVEILGSVTCFNVNQILFGIILWFDLTTYQTEKQLVGFDFLHPTAMKQQIWSFPTAQHIDESTISSITKDVLLSDLKLLLGPSLLILKLFEALQIKNNQYTVEYIDESLPGEFSIVGQSAASQHYDPVLENVPYL
jgi:hypothetical protein